MSEAPLAGPPSEERSEAPESRPGQEGLHAVLQERFGLSSFRRGQEEILAAVLAGRDTVGVMPTGGGKSLCYQLPAALNGQIVAVISPLISLMNDQVLALRRLGIPAGCIHSNQGEAEKREVFGAMRQGGPYVLYISPERVQKAGFANWVRDQPLGLFAVDEAHCLSLWGPDFRPDYYKLNRLRELRPDVPLLALTATATPPVIKDIGKVLGMQDPALLSYGFYRPNLYYQVEACDHDAAKLAHLKQALEQMPSGRAIVYCGTRRHSEELSSLLQGPQRPVAYYHAGMDAEERTRVQAAFTSGAVRVLTATTAFGMGVDHPDVRLVAHYSLPGSLEAYYQEAGRAGRDVAPATCLLLHAKKDRALQGHFIRQSDAAPEVKRFRWDALEDLTRYATAGRCRNAAILSYFRDAQSLERCGHCDVCAPEDERHVKLPEGLRVPKPTRRARGAVPPDEPLLDEAAKGRATALRAWRKAYAKERELPAYTVFSDRTLRELARKIPGTQTALLDIHGLGAHKVDLFGAELLNVLRGEA